MIYSFDLFRRFRSAKMVPVLLLFLTVGLLVGCQGPSPQTEVAVSPTVAERVPDDWAYDLSAPTPTAPRGMVATDAKRATQVGQRILKRLRPPLRSQSCTGRPATSAGADLWLPT